MKLKQFNIDCKSFRNFDDAIRRESTRRSYHYSLDAFMRFAKLTDYDALVKLETDEIQSLLENWVRSHKKKNLAHNTISTKLNPVELFLDMNKKTWYKRIVRKMLPDSDRMPGGDVPFTTEEVAQLKQAAKKPRDIAVIDFLASTGVRPGCLEDPVLRLKHLEEIPDTGCTAVKVYDESREGYWAFLTPEATQSMQKYLKRRRFNQEELGPESILFKNYDSPNKKKDHLTADSVRQMLVNLLKLSGIEREKTGKRFNKAVMYGFRKRFNGILKMNNDVNSNIAEKLMAHKNGLDGNYLKPTREQCFAEFAKAVSDLTISNEFRDKVKIAKLEEEKSEIEILHSDVSKLKKEMELELDFRKELLEFSKYSKRPEFKEGLEAKKLLKYCQWLDLKKIADSPKSFSEIKEQITKKPEDFPLLSMTINRIKHNETAKALEF